MVCYNISHARANIDCHRLSAEGCARAFASTGFDSGGDGLGAGGDLCPFRAFLIGDRFCALAARFVGKIYELLSAGMSLSLLLSRRRCRDFLAIFTFNFSLLFMPL